MDPDGRDWIKNMETWRYEWRDDISANSDDILNDLNINKEYSMRSENLFYVAGEKESYDKNNISSNNSLGRVFEGIMFTAVTVQSSVNTNNPFARELGSMFEIGYGNESTIRLNQYTGQDVGS